MKTLIAYASQYGATEECAHLLAKQLSGQIDLVHLDGKNTPDAAAYDAVVVGGSVRAGRLLKSAAEFCRTAQPTLLAKRLGLFVCCGFAHEGESYLAQNYPQPLLDAAAAKGVFGGAFNTDKMGFFAKKIVQAVGKNGPPPAIDKEAIAHFARQMATTA